MRLAYLTVANTFAVLGLLLATDREKDTEILVLRHQVAVLERQLGGKKVRFSPADRAWLAALPHRLRPHVLGRMRLLVRPTPCCAGTVTWSASGTLPGPGPSGRAGPAPCARSAPWSCARSGRTPPGATGGCTVAARARGEGGSLYGVGDLEGCQDRPGARTLGHDLGQLPVIPGRGPLGLRLLRNGHPAGDAGVRASGDRAPHPPDPGARRDRAPNLWVPETMSLHATCEYSRIRPPSRS